MNTTKTLIVASLILAATAVEATQAQTTPAPTQTPVAVTPPPAQGSTTPRINARQRRQQARIREGVANGSLTGKETRTLERQEAKIQSQKLMDKAKNGGTLTPAERKQINHEQNVESRSIYRKKHNARVQQP